MLRIIQSSSPPSLGVGGGGLIYLRLLQYTRLLKAVVLSYILVSTYVNILWTFQENSESFMKKILLTINVPVVYMVRYKVVLRGDYP